MRRSNHPKPSFFNRWRGLFSAADPRAPAVLMILTVALPLGVAVLVLPMTVVLPAFGLWTLSCAALIALVATARPRRRSPDAVSAWDVAGAFTLIGCAATIIGEVEHMIEYLWSWQSRNQAHD